MIEQSTKVTFPGRAISGKSVVLACEDFQPNTTKTAIIVAETPFHPVDHYWSDQPGDKGIIKVNSNEYVVEQCLTAAVKQGSEQLFFDQDIPVKRDDPEWFYLVAHIIDKQDVSRDLVGSEATLEVDKNYRQALSKAHSICHLASLALNKVAVPYWKKEFERQDSLGNNDLDGVAIIESRVSAEGSVDRYRVGKSLRKKGFAAAEFFENLTEVANKIQQQLLSWSVEPIRITVNPAASYLTDKREWSCVLPDGTAKIFCGGTHLPEITQQDLGDIKILLHRENDEPVFTMKITKC